MKKVLITGFEPFGGADVNPALEAVKKLNGRELNGGVIVTCDVPVVRFNAIDAVMKAVELHQPDVVITVGQAGGRAAITPERVAINVDDFRIPDNAGIQVIDEPIYEQAPNAYFSTLPIKAIVHRLQEMNIPAQVSNTAGTFVCNHLFYGVANQLAKTKVRNGFIHIPYLPEQTAKLDQPSMSLDLIVEGLALAAQATLEHDEDLQATGGTIC